MALVNVSPLSPSTINTSGTDSVSFLGLGTLNIVGTQQAPITVTLSQVAGIGLLDTINITYADVTLGGAAGVSALVTYNIGVGGTLRLTGNLGLSAGTSFNFTGTNSHLVIGSGVDLNLLGAINGFGPGSNIDVASPFASYIYTDNAGINTGGTLTLRDGAGNAVKTVTLNTGEFTAPDFNVHLDGNGGTLIDFATRVSSITATPATADLTVGGNVVLTLAMNAPVTITGTPTLTLSDGGSATYDALNSTATSLVFRHTVAPGQNTADLTVTGVNLSGASVRDALGNTVNLSGGPTNPAGILQIDTAAPIVASVTTSPGNGSLGAGQIVSINVTPSEAVTVAGGTPILTLNDGGIAAYDAASSSSTLLVFKYVVQPNENIADLAISGASLNGAVITDGAGNPMSLSGAIGNPAGVLQIDTTAPTVLGLTAQPGSGSFTTGQVIAFNVTTSEAVAVANGTPTLTLNDGGTATYDAASSTPTVMVFKYTVQPGQNTADLTVTGTSLNGATITDPAGNAISLGAAVGNPAGILQIDTIVPTVVNVTTSPGSGTLAAGQVVAINVTPSEAVTVSGGTPTLTLSDGGIATYDAANSTSTLLVFKHVIQPGQNTADLTITAANLNGAIIADPAGNALTLSGAVGNPPGILQIDTTLPSVTSVFSVTATPGTADLTVGGTVALQVTLTGNATVTGGTPTLSLNDGGTATYDAASSTPSSLIFRYTVQPGQNTADLTVTAISLNGAAVSDSNGNAVDFSGTPGNPAGILQIDTIVPTITAVTTTPGSGALAAGQIVAINVSTSEAITVGGGTPTLTLNDGGTATYDATNSTPTLLVFNYTVQPGQNTADLTITAANLNSATIADAAGNAVNLANVVGNPAGILQIDTIVPTVTSVTTSPGSGTLAVGQIVTINVTPSEAITVAGGTPTLTLDDGGTATYDAGSSTPTLMVFRYTVQPGQNSADLTITAANLNGATIADPAGNALSLSGAIGNPPGILQVNTMPVVTSLVATPANGDLTIGATIALQVSISTPVTVTGGTPTLALNDGGTAVYDAASSTPTLLVFRNTVQAGQNTFDLTVTGTSLNGATIADATGNALNLAAALGNPAGILQVDTTAPIVTNVTTSPGSGTLAAGQVVVINVTPSEAVSVNGGMPTLALNNGGTATYDATDSTPTLLVFKYVVQPGQNTGDLTITAGNLNGAIIADPAGNALTLSGAVGNPPGILQIDTTLPPVTSVFSVTATPGTADLTVGGTVALQVTLTGNATVTGGTPTLILNDGGTATYDAASSTPSSLIFLHTVQPGQNTADLTVTAVSLNGAVVADSNGNAVDFSGAVLNPAGTLQVDTIVPTLTAVATTPFNGALAAGQIVTINVSTSEAVTVVGGTPTLTLNDGGTATYDATNSTPRLLVFNYTVQPGQNTADLAITAGNLNGATIADGAGNAVNLSGAVGNPAGILQIDTIAPTITTVTTSPGSGSLAAGQVVTINVSTSEAITVIGGTPTLTLDGGGTATYDAASSTPTLMVFRYAVQSGQNSADLTITAGNLNGATIADAAGNALSLSGAVGNPPGTLQINTVPIVTSVVATPANGDLTIGGTIVLQISTSGPVSITGGTPTLALNDGGTATYDAASSTPTLLVFRNTVRAGENTPDLTVTGTNLNGATIADSAGNIVSIAAAAANPAGILQIDTINPTAVSIVETRPLQGGGTLSIVINVSEAVTVSGGPAMFFLSNGGTATFNPLLSTPTSLVATYTVPADQDVSELSITGFSPNGSTVSDGAGNLIDARTVFAALAAAQGNASDVTQGTAPKTIDVYRFFDTKTGTHFYTQDPAERAAVLATRPDLVPEGPNGVGLTAIDPASNDPNAMAVYRFFDLKQGTHFFTASTTERDAVIATRTDLVYEPSSTFYEHTTPQAGDTPVYRFFDTTYGTHFYTDDPKERASILQNRSDLVSEGIGFYEPARNPST